MLLFSLIAGVFSSCSDDPSGSSQKLVSDSFSYRYEGEVSECAEDSLLSVLELKITDELAEHILNDTLQGYSPSLLIGTENEGTVSWRSADIRRMSVERPIQEFNPITQSIETHFKRSRVYTVHTQTCLPWLYDYELSSVQFHFRAFTPKGRLGICGSVDYPFKSKHPTDMRPRSYVADSIPLSNFGLLNGYYSELDDKGLPYQPAGINSYSYVKNCRSIRRTKAANASKISHIIQVQKVEYLSTCMASEVDVGFEPIIEISFDGETFISLEDSASMSEVTVPDSLTDTSHIELYTKTTMKDMETVDTLTIVLNDSLFLEEMSDLNTDWSERLPPSEILNFREILDQSEINDYSSSLETCISVLGLEEESSEIGIGDVIDLYDAVYSESVYNY